MTKSSFSTQMDSWPGGWGVVGRVVLVALQNILPKKNLSYPDLHDPTNMLEP